MSSRCQTLRKQMPKCKHLQRLAKDAPSPTRKRNTVILGGPRKFGWSFFGDNSTRKQELFRSRNSLKSPSKPWAGKFSNRNWPSHEALVDELSARIPTTTLNEVRAKTSA